MAQCRLHVLIRGRVQGVFFRESTRRQAEELGLSGFVRNLPDGCVEAYFVGEEEAVQSGLDFLRRGPPGARVDSVEPYAPQSGTCETSQDGFMILPRPERGKT